MLKRALSLCVVLSVFAGMAVGQSGPSLSFIDRWGDDAPQVVEYDFARVRLTDPALDVSGQRDTVDVIVSSVLGPDQETVTLTETGKRTGVFEGGIDLRINGGSPAFPGILETMGPSGSFDSLQVDADGGLSDTAQVVPSILRLVDDQGDEVTAFSAGGRVFVRLIDRLSDTPNPDTTTVTLTTSNGDSEVVTLAESSVSGGEFTGSIATRLAGGSTSGDGNLDTLAGATLTASHEDVNNVTSSSDTALLAGATLRFVDSRGLPTSTALEETRITLQAISASANVFPAFPDEIYATLTSELGGDQETLTLVETGASTGVFEGRIRMGINQYGGPGNGQIQISPSDPGEDVIEANVSGAAPATLHPSGSSTRLLDVWGRDAETFPQGGTLTVRVEDPASDLLYGGLQISGAQVRSLTTGDVEYPTLDETGVGSNVYEGTIPLEIGPAVPGDGKLQAQVEGEFLEARHNDVNGVTASMDTGRLSLSEMWFLDEDSREPTGAVLENTRVTLRLFDALRSTPGAADIASENAGDGENLFFAPDLGKPGFFEGSIPTETQSYFTPSGDNVLGTRANLNSLDGLETITAWAGSPADSATARAVYSEIAFVDAHGNAVESYALGEAVHVRLRSGSPGTSSIDQVQIVLLSLSTGDQETMTLDETGPDTNVYLGSFPTTNGTASPGNGWLETRAGETLVAEDSRADYPLSFTLDRAAVTTNRVTFVDRQNAPTGFVFRGGRAYLEAFDRTANANAGAIETLDVKVRVYADSDGQLVDTEMVTLTETGADTALFRGSIPVSMNTVGINGVLDTRFNMPYHGPDRLRADLGGSSGAAEVTDSVVRFLNLQGDDVSIYEIGDTIRIRLQREASNESPFDAETATLSLTSWSGRAALSPSFDGESLVLTETGPDTGVFEGEIETAGGAAALDDGTFQAPSGGELQVQFNSSWTEDADRAFMAGSSPTPVNDPPVANGDFVTVSEDSALQIDVLANDTDPDGDPLSIVSFTQGVKGSVSSFGGGLLYTTNLNATGADSFTYTIEDTSGATATATVSVTITPVNDPPVAVANSATTNEDTAVTVFVLANDSDPEGDSLTVSAVTQGSHGSVTRFTTSVAYTPAANYFGTDSFTYTASDGHGGTATATVSVTINSVNDVPVAGNNSATTNEDTPVTVNVLANDSDADGDPLTITSATNGTKGVVTVNAGSTVTYTPNLNATGSDSFTYTISDGRGGTKTATVTITIVAVNDAPNAVNDARTTAEDTAINIAILANDSDPEGQTLTVTAVTQGTSGSVVLNADKTVTYTPNWNFVGSDSFTYTISDGTLTATATVSLSVTDANDPPYAVDDEITVAEDETVSFYVLSNDSDPEGDTIYVSKVLPATHGVAGGPGLNYVLTYTPKPNFHGEDFFVYTVSDTNFGTNSATVMIIVTPVDDPPVAVNDAATVTEDSAATAVNVLANDTDVDGGPKSIDSVTQPANGTVVITGGGTGLTYQPNANYCNNPPGTTLDTFTYTLTPGGSTATVTMTVTCVDDAPSAVNDAATVNEDSSANALNALANDADADGGPKSVSSVTQPANGAVVITGGGTGLTYQPNANFCSATPDAFTYTVSPGGSSTTVSVIVTCVDDPPTAVADAATVTEDSGANAINVLANDTDIDAGPISIASVTQPANGTVVITNGGADLAYAPNANFCGTPDTFTYTLTPGGSTAAVSVSVTCLNDGPVVDLDANDDQGTGGDDFAVTFTEGEAARLIEDPFDTTVTDVDSATLESITVTITNLLDDGSETLSADVTGTSITDSYVPATGVLTLTGPDTLANFQTVLRTVRYLNTDESSDPTPRVITFVASDGATDGNTAVATVTVVPVDTPPTAVNDAATVNEDSGINAIDVLANDTDPDGGPISISSVTQPTNGTVIITGGGTGLTYQPNTNFCGTPGTFTYTLTPGGSTATVTVTVTCVNDAPDAVNDSASTNEDTAVTISVLANDSDAEGQTLSVSAVTQGTKGTVTINGNGTVTYTPALNTNGADAFTYTISDGNGGSDTATVTVSVAAVNDAPVAVADTATTREGAAVTVTVLANDSDVEGNTLTVTSVTAPSGGTAAVNANNTVTYTPGANFNGTGSFTYTVSDGQGGTATATVTVTVKDALERVAVLATHGVWIQTGADVLSGDVIVNQTGAAPFLTGSVELSLAGTVTTPAGYDVQANRISVASGATVASDVFYNQLTGTVTGPQTSPLTLPVFATLPTFLTATPGTTDVNVATNGTRTLAAGSYRDLIVGRKGTVTFTGGTYHFRTVQIDREAKLLFTAAATVRVQQKLSTLQTTQIQPAAGATIDGSDIVIHVGGVNGTGGGLTETPKAVEIAVDNVIWANVYAPNGTIWMKDRTQLRGVLLGKDVQLGPDVQVTLDSSFTGQ